MRSLSLSREPEDLPKEPPGPPPVEPKGMKRFAATGAAQTGVALAKLKGSIAERKEENIGAQIAFLRTQRVQQLAHERETKKAGGIAEKLEREESGCASGCRANPIHHHFTKTHHETVQAKRFQVPT